MSGITPTSYHPYVPYLVQTHTLTSLDRHRTNRQTYSCRPFQPTRRASSLGWNYRPCIRRQYSSSANIKPLLVNNKHHTSIIIPFHPSFPSCLISLSLPSQLSEHSSFRPVVLIPPSPYQRREAPSLENWKEAFDAAAECVGVGKLSLFHRDVVEARRRHGSLMKPWLMDCMVFLV